ncbi:ribokinase [Paenibacillus faecalis]|uniref:ribokinase n=1 Tax=Paenibacillus faecalis TaxID=2079532 RepID=UPI0018F8A040|nr:ribokinase [Paenibacillus faecalis]
MITVIGSLNMDLISIVDRYPKLGETIIGKEFHQNFGGKGANQAVAAARLGSSVNMIGRVGEDSFGTQYLSHLKNECINIDNVEPVTQTSTGISSITITEGDNLIVVVPGANYELTPVDIDACKEQIESSNVILLQLEIPMETVARVLEIASNKGITTILNPAPYQEFPSEWWDMITYLTPNEHEAEMLMNSPSFCEKYKEKLIITKGKQGIAYHKNGKDIFIKAPEVQVEDTTGAGDTFNGALSCFLDKGYEFHDACYHAAFAASLSVTKFGAQGGMPSLQELKDFTG